MTIEQTVKIPENRRLTIEVPREIPVGEAILTFTPKSVEPANKKNAQVSLKEAIETACNLAKNSRFSSEALFEERRKDRALDEAQFRRLFPKGGEVD
jgi:hypothetical protein